MFSKISAKYTEFNYLMYIIFEHMHNDRIFDQLVSINTVVKTHKDWVILKELLSLTVMRKRPERLIGKTYGLFS